MTTKDALQAVCDEIGISLSEGIGFFEYALNNGDICGDTVAFDLKETSGQLRTGKNKFKQFIKAAERARLVKSATIFRPTQAIDTSALSALKALKALKESSTGLERKCDFVKFNDFFDLGESLPEAVKAFQTVPEEAEVRRAKAIESQAWEAQAAAALAKLWHPELVQRIVSIGLSETATGEVSWKTILNSYYEPVLRLQTRFHIDRDVIAYALEETVRRNIGNVMYAVAVAKAEQKKRAEQTVSRATLGEGAEQVFYTEEGIACGQLDTWALHDPRYRDAYISCFGQPTNE